MDKIGSLPDYSTYNAHDLFKIIESQAVDVVAARLAYAECYRRYHEILFFQCDKAVKSLPFADKNLGEEVYSNIIVKMYDRPEYFTNIARIEANQAMDNRVIRYLSVMAYNEMNSRLKGATRGIEYDSFRQLDFDLNRISVTKVPVKITLDREAYLLANQVQKALTEKEFEILRMYREHADESGKLPPFLRSCLKAEYNLTDAGLRKAHERAKDKLTKTIDKFSSLKTKPHETPTKTKQPPTTRT